MPGPVDHLDTVGEVVEELRGLGFEPVLVGGHGPGGIGITSSDP
jgi:hypothetical protein